MKGVSSVGGGALVHGFDFDIDKWEITLVLRLQIVSTCWVPNMTLIIHALVDNESRVAAAIIVDVN